MNWQDISTAPKGIPIWAIHKDNKHHKVWTGVIKTVQGVEDCFVIKDIDSYSNITMANPTHWAPLEPPEEG